MYYKFEQKLLKNSESLITCKDELLSVLTSYAELVDKLQQNIDKCNDYR